MNRLTQYCKLLLMVTTLIISVLAQAKELDQIQWMTEHYPPYNYLDDGKLQGISVELLALILQRMESKQSIDNVKMLPWARGYRTLQSQKNSALFSISKSYKRKPLFKWVGPIGSITIAMITTSNKEISIKTVSDLANYKVAAVRSDIGEQLLLNTGLPRSKIISISTVNAISMAIQMLERGRIDLFIYGEKGAYWQMKKMGKDRSKFKTVYRFDETGLYYAFHANVSTNLITQLQQHLDDIKKNGELDRIIHHYN